MKSQPQYPLRRFLLLLSLLVTWPAAIVLGQAEVKSPPARAATTRKTISYAFVSPNTLEGLTLADAVLGLNSPGERRLINDTRLLACRLRLTVRVQKAVGSWLDGAENSTLLRANTDQATIRYAASWLGKAARQKSVLYFLTSSFGGSRMYVLRVPGGPRSMTALTIELDSNGVSNRTLVPRKGRLLVYIVDLKNELQEKVRTTARHLRARSLSIRGDAAFIGDENDREKAQTSFQREIVNYEVKHPGARRACGRQRRSSHCSICIDSATLLL